MDEKESNERKEKEEVFSQTVRAGKRTYFFDVKTNPNDTLYLTITESKRKFEEETGKFFYQKHKLYLYAEDFDKFLKGLNDSMQFIKTGEIPQVEPKIEAEAEIEVKEETKTDFSDIDFDDLTGKEPNT